jgi:DNA polymerase-3 subunit delta'
VVLVGRGVYPAEVLGKDDEEKAFISVQQIRKIVLARAGFPPHEGRALVFLVRAAHELHASAASALLKTLEEPAARTHFVLLSSRPDRLLDTIRSRTLAVRFAPLPDEVVRRVLREQGVPAEAAELAIRLAGGSLARAFALANEARLRVRREVVRAVHAALDAPDLAHAMAAVEDLPREREGLREQLLDVAHAFAEEARGAVTADPGSAERAARRHAEVHRAVDELERFAQPALALDAMLARLRRA